MKRISFTIFLGLLSFFQLSAQDQTDIFPDIKNWTLGEIKSWDNTNLYVPINGAADLFLAYNFEKLLQTDYSRDSNYITVEVYRHKTSEDAFGVYSQERPDRDIYVEIGVQGYKEDDYFFLVAGNNYIKIRTHKAEELSIDAMNILAEKLAIALNEDAALPQLFSVFPENNKVPFSEMYINENIMGFSFLHHSYELSYDDQGSKYTLFILAGGDEEESAAMLKSYLEYLKLPTDKSTDGFYAIDDLYTGQVYLLKEGRCLIGSRGSISEEDSRSLLKAMAGKLELE